MKNTKDIRFKVLPTGDPQSLFYRGDLSPQEILKRLGRPTRLLSRSAKTDKSEALGFKTAVLYLTSSVLCPRSSESCRRFCLGHASGRMMMPTHAQARDRKTALFFTDREHFLHLLRRDLDEHCWAAKREGLTPAVRLNGASDVPYELICPELLESYGDSDNLVAYDYSKVASRCHAFLDPSRPFPKNYHLTFSAHENNGHEAESILRAGGNVAIVFSGPDLPETFGNDKNGRYPVLDGDADDCRFLDESPRIVGLRLKFKGNAKEACRSGFVLPSPGKESLSILAN